MECAAASRRQTRPQAEVMAGRPHLAEPYSLMRIGIDGEMAGRLMGEAKRRCVAYSGATTRTEMLGLGGTPNDFIFGCLRGYIIGPGVDEFMWLVRDMTKPYGHARPAWRMRQIAWELSRARRTPTDRKCP